MKKKLSKQSIFTILGILVIAGSIPMAVLLVQQRQDIRKEAASWDGTRCAQTDQAECTDWGSPATAYCATKCGGGSTTNTTSSSANCGSLGGTDCTYSSSRLQSGEWDCIVIPNANDCNPCLKCTAKTSTSTTTTTNSTTCTPGTWSSSLCTRCLDSGEWPQGGIACPAGNLDFGSQNKDGDAGYTDAAHCDCQRRCWGADKMTTNCGGPIPIENAPGNESTPGNTSRSWGLYKTGVDCSTPTLAFCNNGCNSTTHPPISCAGNLVCSTTSREPGASGVCRNPSCLDNANCICASPTPTPTTPTPTPTTTVGCNLSCTNNNNCNSGLICSSGYCRNQNCTAETSCNCPGPTSTPTPNPTSTPVPTTTLTVVATPTPVVQLPTAGFTLPTFGAIFGGTLFVILASILFLL